MLGIYCVRFKLAKKLKTILSHSRAINIFHLQSRRAITGILEELHSAVDKTAKAVPTVVDKNIKTVMEGTAKKKFCNEQNSERLQCRDEESIADFLESSGQTDQDIDVDGGDDCEVINGPECKKSRDGDRQGSDRTRDGDGHGSDRRVSNGQESEDNRVSNEQDRKENQVSDGQNSEESQVSVGQDSEESGVSDGQAREESKVSDGQDSEESRVSDGQDSEEGRVSNG